MIIFSDTRDQIFNSRDPNWVPKTRDRPIYQPGRYTRLIFGFHVYRYRPKRPILLALVVVDKTLFSSCI